MREVRIAVASERRENGLESLASYTQVKNVCVKFS
jgi:hypothetical protein